MEKKEKTILGFITVLIYGLNIVLFKHQNNFKKELYYIEICCMPIKGEI